MRSLVLLLLVSCNIQATTLSDLLGDLNESAIVADKQNGKLYVYDASVPKISVTSALFGKEHTDTYVLSDYDVEGKAGAITPAGTFTSSKLFSKRLNLPITAFVKGAQAFVAIHPVWLGKPAQRRIERLNSPESTDNRITNGCVNIAPEFYYQVVDKLRSNTRVVILPESDSVIDDVSSTLTVGTKVVVEKPKVTTQYGAVPGYDEASLAGETGSAGLNY